MGLILLLYKRKSKMHLDKGYLRCAESSHPCPGGYTGAADSVHPRTPTAELPHSGSLQIRGLERERRK